MYILHLALKTFRNRSSFYFKIGYLLPVRLRNKSVLKPTTFLSRVQNMVKLGRFKKSEVTGVIVIGAGYYLHFGQIPFLFPVSLTTSFN